MSDDVETLSDEQLRIRDLVYEGLRPAAGLVLTEHVMQQRAAAIARALVGHFVRGSVAKGEIVTMDRAAEDRIIADVRRHGNGHFFETPGMETHYRALAYRCPTCGAPATFNCDNGDPHTANNCPARNALVETPEQHAERIIR